MKIRRAGHRAGLSMSLALLVVAWGCADGTPTSTDGSRVPIDVTTIEVRLPFDDFATDFQVFSGFGSAAQLFPRVVAHEWGGDLDIYALYRFGALPNQIFVFPPGETTTSPDEEYVVIGGEIHVRLSYDEELGTGPFELEAGTIETAWHPSSASWEFAVDTLGNQLAWAEPGGGPSSVIGTATWTPQAEPDEPEEEQNGDEEDEENGEEEEPVELNLVTIPVDSATANHWVDTGRLDRGLRLSVLTPGSRIEVANVRFEALARSSINPDTVVAVSSGAAPASTVIYSPDPGLSTEAFQVGGAPARRATFRVELPATVDPGPEVCAVVECPVELRSDRFVYAGLELYTRAVDPVGLRPPDDRIVELRPVLAPDRLPRSPLAAPLACPRSECAMIMQPTIVPSDAFFAASGSRIDLPMTRHVRDLTTEIGAEETRVPATVAIVGGRNPQTGSEILALDRLTFYGPGTEFEPALRLILTLSDEMGLP